MGLKPSGGGGQHQTNRPAPGRPLLASPAPDGAGARSAGRALRVHQQPLHSAGAPMLAPVLLHSAAGPLSAAASLPTPGPHRWQLLRATGRGATACGRWWGLPSGPLGRPTRPQRPAGRTPAHPGRRAAARPVHPPAGAGRGNVAAKAGPLRARPGQVGRQPLHGGTPPQCKAKPLRGRLQRALHCSSPVPVAAQVLRGGPAPTVWGLWGRPPLRPRP